MTDSDVPRDLTKLKGFLAPVFTCFKDDERRSLNLDFIENYAAWLKSVGAKGVLVNSITGEGPILGKAERQLNAETWSAVCKKWKLLMILQIGGAPLPDVLELARHSNTLHLQGILCIPELFYKPRDIEQLVGYCKMVAKNCNQHPFLYYHIPRTTGLYFDMPEFCKRAEAAIPNFVGLEYSHSDLAMAVKCFSPKRVVILSDSRLLSSGLLLGFKAFCMATFNMVPELMLNIYGAMIDQNLKRAKDGQKNLNILIRDNTSKFRRANWVKAMKRWFNESMKEPSRAQLSAGRARKLY